MRSPARRFLGSHESNANGRNRLATFCFVMFVFSNAYRSEFRQDLFGVNWQCLETRKIAEPVTVGADAMPKELLDNEAAARYLGISPATLNTLRCRGDSPPYYKVGRRVLMDRADLDSWLDARRRHNSSAPTIQTTTRARR